MLAESCARQIFGYGGEGGKPEPKKPKPPVDPGAAEPAPADVPKDK
jgi:hypothetical protein